MMTGTGQRGFESIGVFDFPDVAFLHKRNLFVAVAHKRSILAGLDGIVEVLFERPGECVDLPNLRSKSSLRVSAVMCWAYSLGIKRSNTVTSASIAWTKDRSVLRGVSCAKKLKSPSVITQP